MPFTVIAMRNYGNKDRLYSHYCGLNTVFPGITVTITGIKAELLTH